MVEQIGSDELDPVANAAKIRMVGSDVTNDADDLVVSVEEELCKIGAVLPGDTGDDRTLQLSALT